MIVAEQENNSVGFRLWTVRDVAVLLGVAEQTIRKWVWERRIPSVKIGGRRMFERDEIIRWIEENRSPEVGGVR